MFNIMLISLILLVGCNNEEELEAATEPMTWGMNFSKVEEIIGEAGQFDKYDKWVHLNYESKEVYGIVGDLTYDFENNKLIDVCFDVNSASKEEQENAYNTIKQNIISEYGEADKDEIRESSVTVGTSYQFFEWTNDKTIIQLTYNIDNPDKLNVNTTFQSLEYANAHAETESDTSTQSAENNNAYKTSGQWALDTSYAFAVEVDGYSGDKYSAGTYKFKTTNTTMGEAPMYDIYIESAEYNSISQLGSIDYTVGGAGSYPISITLNKGDYVYIVPYTDLLYTPKGYLTFTLSD